MLKSNQSIFMLTLKVLAIWMLVSIVILLVGERLLELMLPYFSSIMNMLAQHYTSVLTITEIDNARMIQVTATLTQPVYISAIPVAPAGYQLAAATNIAHSYVPIVILYTALIAWSVHSTGERIVLLLLGVPTIIIILGLMVPPLLLGHIESALLQAAQNMAQDYLEPPFIMRWVIFSETGGRWLFPIVGAWLCKLAARALTAQ